MATIKLKGREIYLEAWWTLKKLEWTKPCSRKFRESNEVNNLRRYLHCSQTIQFEIDILILKFEVVL